MEKITFGRPNYDNPAKIERIARIHESGPLDWIPAKDPTPKKRP